MSAIDSSQSLFNSQRVLVDGVTMHVVRAGKPEKPAIFFLHGFPENWFSFEQVMALLYRDFHVVAIELPGIGTSGRILSTTKLAIAKFVRRIIETLKLENVTLVGHDVGGMITYAYLHAFSNELEAAVIINTAVPGVDPWSEMKRNPAIWHFALHAIPELPEVLVTGRERIYFDYFFNTISARPDAITRKARSIYTDAYAKPDSLKTAFDWYRSFAQDERDNLTARDTAIETPVLYLRGDKAYGNVDLYVRGFQEAGLANIEGKVIPDCGHFAAEEQPQHVANFIRTFKAQHSASAAAGAESMPFE